jgi:hypothetical protein
VAFAVNEYKHIVEARRDGADFRKFRFNDSDDVSPNGHSDQSICEIIGKTPGHLRLRQDPNPTLILINNALEASASKTKVQVTIKDFNQYYLTLIDLAVEKFPDVFEQLEGDFTAPLFDTMHQDNKLKCIHVGHFDVKSGNEAMPKYSMGRLNRGSEIHKKVRPGILSLQ